MYDVIGVGANSVDLVYRLPEYPHVAKLPMADHEVFFGGQVTTALTTCVAMGLRAAYIGTFGSDSRATGMRQELARLGIDTTHAVVRQAANPCAVVVLANPNGERIVLWRRDPEVALRPSDVDGDAIRSARLLHVDDVDREASIEAATVARERRLPVTSDIERTDAGALDMVEAVTVPIFAQHVPAALTGEAEPARALKALRRPQHTMLCVTLGARGAMLVEGDTVHVAPGLPLTTVDTTGAGDVFRGAFICAMLRGDAPRDILRFANAAAALSCTKVGAMASVPTAEDTEALLLEQHEPERRDRQRE